MRLEPAEGADIENPTPEQIRQVLAGVGTASGEYAILNRSDDPPEYLQLAGEGNAFTVEYREGDRQFREPKEAVALETAVTMFQAYARGDEKWRTLVQWTDVTDEIRKPRWPAIIIGIIILAVVAAIIAIQISKAL
jgi:hypothetical protein